MEAATERKGQDVEFWSQPASKLLEQLRSSAQGLSAREAAQRLAQHGPNLLRPRRKTATLHLLLSQFSSPIILILVFAACLAFYLEDRTDTVIILSIVMASGLLGFWQERGAVNAVAKLLALVHIRASVLRDGKPVEVPVEEVVPGDVVLLSAGRGVPGDSLILESQDLFVDEATLTGETYPVEKTPGVLPAETALSQRTNAVFAGTHVVSGTAKAVVVRTGASTEFGKIADRLRLRPAETEFERGGAPVWVPPRGGDPPDAAGCFCHQRLHGAPGSGLLPLCACTGRGANAPAAPGDHQH